MPTKLEINAKFLDCIAKLQRMMRRTEIVEIRIAANETFFINDQGETANLSLPGGSIANPSTRAMDSYLNDLQRIEISSRLPDLVLKEHWLRYLIQYVKIFFQASVIK
ncbi:hypothetical protein F8M41_000134 [Gigaspora margarita]|uniref:Uncharacterized protein n=1 Tax=Gigaspora margarita TaxID=4874 RepID=A0A8H4AZM0_GIGMA|nr:hypothetical protein F8M41_000134 [Gigaspora margarita]